MMQRHFSAQRAASHTYQTKCVSVCVCVCASNRSANEGEAVREGRGGGGAMDVGSLNGSDMSGVIALSSPGEVNQHYILASIRDDRTFVHTSRLVVGTCTPGAIRTTREKEWILGQPCRVQCDVPGL